MNLNKSGKNKNKFVIKRVNLNHNHQDDLNELFFASHPRNRALDDHQLKEVKDMLKTHSKPALIANHVFEKHGAKIIPKDIYNIKQKMFDDFDLSKVPKEQREIVALEKVIEKQRKIDGADYFKFVKSNDSNDLYAIYYQNNKMKEFYSRYPNIIFVDTTYKLNDNNYPAMFLVVQDEEGHSYPVCIIILAYERKSLFDACFKFFLNDNTLTVSKTQAIMIHKDLKEDDMLSKNFPHARILYCFWHVLKTFKLNFNKKSVLKYDFLIKH